MIRALPDAAYDEILDVIRGAVERDPERFKVLFKQKRGEFLPGGRAEDPTASEAKTRNAVEPTDNDVGPVAGEHKAPKIATGQEPLLRIEQAAKILCLSVNTVYRYVEQGRIPVVRLSPRAIRFDPDQLRDWIRERTQLASSNARVKKRLREAELTEAEIDAIESMPIDGRSEVWRQLTAHRFSSGAPACRS